MSIMGHQVLLQPSRSGRRQIDRKSSYHQEERQFNRDLRNAILAEFEKGTGFMDIPKAVRLPRYAHWVGYEEWLEMNTLRLMTDLWMGHFRGFRTHAKWRITAGNTHHD